MDSTQRHQTKAGQGFAAGTLFGALAVFLLLGGAFPSLGTTGVGSRERRAVAAPANAASQIAESEQANAERDVLDLQLD